MLGLVLTAGCYGGLGGGSVPQVSEGSVDDDDGDKDDDDGPPDDDDMGSTGAAEGSSTGSAQSGSSGSDSGEEIEYGAPAHRIRIANVELNPAVSIEIYRDGAFVPVEGWNAHAPAGRRTLLRAQWELDAGWEPREIEGRLTLRGGDGTLTELAEVELVSGPSDPIDRTTTFDWIIEPELATPGVEFSIELIDPALPADTAPPAEPARVPATGLAPLSFDPAAMQLDVTLVPVQHTLSASCPDAPEPAAEHLDNFRARLHAAYPVQSVEIRVREPIGYSSSVAAGYQPLMQHLMWLRGEDGAPPQTIYYGLIDPCGEPPIGGWAWIGDHPTLDNGWMRTGVGTWFDDNDATARILVHEVGHTLGRDHVACSGEEANPDPYYPYSGGVTGSIGWDQNTGELRPADWVDFMTYCTPKFVSDYGFMYSWGPIETMTSWTAAAPPPARFATPPPATDVRISGFCGVQR